MVGLWEAKLLLHIVGMNAAGIINAFGGRQVIATITAARAGAVYMWRQIGVPGKYWNVKL